MRAALDIGGGPTNEPTRRQRFLMLLTRAALVCGRTPTNGPPNVCVYENVVGGNHIQQYFAYVEFVVAMYQMLLNFVFV